MTLWVSFSDLIYSEIVAHPKLSAECFPLDLLITGSFISSFPPFLLPDYCSQDGRLRTGDHILRIGDTPTLGLTSEQVVQVLQACGNRVRMLIARDPLSNAQPPPPPPHAPTTAPIASMHPPIPPHRSSNTVQSCS